jgi:hypothetical protein
MPAAARLYQLPIVRRLLGRGVRLWILARCLLAAAVLLGASAGPRVPPSIPIRLSPATVVLAVLLSGVLGLFEMAARRERILIANLGVSTPELASILLMPAALGETVVALLTAI